MFDYVEFVGEYAPYDLYALENLGRAVDLFDHMTAMMKIEQEPRTYLTIRAIGSGIQNVLFADPRTRGLRLFTFGTCGVRQNGRNCWRAWITSGRSYTRS